MSASSLVPLSPPVNCHLFAAKLRLEEGNNELWILPYPSHLLAVNTISAQTLKSWLATARDQGRVVHQKAVLILSLMNQEEICTIWSGWEGL
jgi:hypothetical protein